jgi:glutamine synthetase
MINRRSGRSGRPGPPPIDGDAYALADLPELPGPLGAALSAFDDDHVLRATLGERFSEYYRTSRAWELKAWRDTVSDWERERYERSV